MSKGNKQSFLQPYLTFFSNYFFRVCPAGCVPASVKDLEFKHKRLPKVMTLLVASFLLFTLILLPLQAGACGWAGDGESDDGDTEVVYIGADGKPVYDEEDQTKAPRFQTKMGNFYRKKTNYAEAIRWYRMAAEQGYAPAQNNLAAMYEQGLGLPQNDASAAKWFRLAAERGNAKAQHSLGIMYSRWPGGSSESQGSGHVDSESSRKRSSFSPGADRHHILEWRGCPQR